jgi:hypothetical protein
MPQELLGVRAAIDAALGRRFSDAVETAWSDAGVLPGDPDWAGGATFVDRRSTVVAAAPACVFRVFSRLGGHHGYFGADWLWRIRGAMDRLVGGPGLRRGRRDPERLAFGEAVDFWRVSNVTAARRLELRAEMRLPGEATLTFEVTPDSADPQRSRLEQTARFKPRGLAGLLYWYAILPLHGVVFNSMLHGIRRAAEAEAERAAAAGTTGSPP